MHPDDFLSIPGYEIKGFALLRKALKYPYLNSLPISTKIRGFSERFINLSILAGIMNRSRPEKGLLL